MKEEGIHNQQAMHLDGEVHCPLRVAKGVTKLEG
jgi:hypothetical protein